MFTVLLIENDNLVASYLNSFLRARKINLVETMDVWLGSRLARELEPDLILIHLEFQPVEIYTLIKKLKQSSNSSQIPIIFLGAATDSKSSELALELGANTAITTPLESSCLKAIIDQYLTPNLQPTYCPA